MNINELYDNRLRELKRVSYDDLSNVFIQHGIIHCFIEAYDLSMELFRKSLQSEPVEMGVLEVLSLTPKELLMTVYDSYAFMNEIIWLDLYRERYYPNFSEPVYERASRIVKQYLPEVLLLQNMLYP